MGNMSPQQMQNNLNMMNPEMMKNASNMMAGMSDSQIQMYLAQMGMTGIDPSMFRSMCQNMSNMSDSQFNSMKNMAQTNFQNMSNNNNNANNSNNDNKYTGTIVQKVTKIKEDGNNLFRTSKYEEAIKKYYEAIEEIKTTIDRDKYKNELDDIERTCRLNIANCKLKTKDYDGVINECSIVLENKKCFKGYYRMGLALMNKNKYDKAYRYLDNANAIGTASEKQAVEPHLKQCKEKLDEIKKKKGKKDSKKKMKKKLKKKNRKKKIKKKEKKNLKKKLKKKRKKKRKKKKKKKKKIIIK